MSFTTEQPSSFDFEDCCICGEEFSTDTELAAHLIQHAEENSNDGGKSDGQLTPIGSPQFPSGEFSEYITTTLNEPQRSKSPEVLDIVSDDSDDDKKLLQQLTKPVSSSSKPVQNTSFQSNAQQRVASTNKQYSQMKPPFRCTSCSSVFTDPKLFRDHLLTHEKPRPYACNICNKTFAYKGTLRQHLRLHVGEKMHKCTVCHKKFTIKAVLKKHCEEVHGLFSNT